MRHSAYLAARYLAHHRGRTAWLVLALALIVTLPILVQAVFAATQARLTDRAAATPLVIGARGSAVDLVLASLYFAGPPPEPVSMATSESVWDSGLADAIPLLLGFSAEGAPIVGTTLDYFDLRGLRVAQGRGLTLLGEAVLGAEVAGRLGLGPGDALISTPATLFDLAGAYPLKMSVVGVLAPTGGPDDRAVLVDIQTAWVIAGIGHGHESVAGGDGPTLAGPPQPGPANTVAPPALRTYAEITAENIDSFHFHGDPATYPVTAVIAVPRDARAGTILQGRYLAPERTDQIAVPAQVVGRLIATLLSLKSVLDLALILAGVAAAIGIGLALSLARQLRGPELATMARLGAARGTAAGLVAAELGVVLILAALVAGLCLVLAAPFLDPAIDFLIRPV